MKTFFPLVCCLGLAVTAFGQMQRTLHQTFAIDTAEVIQFDLFGDYKVEPWAGSSILTETTVKLYETSEAVMKYFIENGRYEMEARPEATVLHIVSKDQERRPIKTKRGERFEVVEMRIFLPENFEQSGDHTWARKSEGG